MKLINDNGKKLCSYNTNEIDIDKYEFVFKNNFLDNIDDIRENINDEENITLIEKKRKDSEVNPRGFMRDILTKYIVNNIFNNKKENDIIHIINKIMKILYEKYYEETGIKLLFVYRGGNILNLYKTNFEQYLPGIAREYLKEEFDQFFKVSDIDFYTVIEKGERLDKEKVKEINKDIQILCYYGLYVARVFIMNDKTLFEFCKFNNDYLKEQFLKIIEEFNEKKDESQNKDVKQSSFIGLGFNKNIFVNNPVDINLKSVNNEFVEGMKENVFEDYVKYKKCGRKDINIDVDDDNKNMYINKVSYNIPDLFKKSFSKLTEELVNKNDQILDFFISNNNKIINNERSQSFSLVRLMINFMVIFERDGMNGVTNASSELFDLSIGDPDDSGYEIYISKNLTKYKFKYNEDREDTVWIPKIDTTILDLLNILYTNYPWNADKYEKRLYRLLLLIFVDQLSKTSIYTLIRNMKSNKIRRNIDDDEIDFEYLKYKNKEMRNGLPKKEEKNYYEYINLFDRINKKLENVLFRIETYIKKLGKFEKEDILL
jgi:hypothetical protein